MSNPTDIIALANALKDDPTSVADTECTYDKETMNDHVNHPHHEYWCCEKCLAKKIFGLASALLIAVDSLEHLTKAMSASDAKEAQEALSRICSIKVQ